MEVRPDIYLVESKGSRKAVNIAEQRQRERFYVSDWSVRVVEVKLLSKQINGGDLGQKVKKKKHKNHNKPRLF